MNRWIITLALIGALLIVGAVALAQESDTGLLQGDMVFVVRRGDVLDMIAAFYDVDVACLIEQNDLPESGLIFPNQEIVISDTCPRYAGTAQVIYPRTVGGIAPGEYIIGRGDVLDILAATFNLDLACLLERNQIEDVRRIQPGQRIVLPADCPAYAGLSTPRPGMIHGLLARGADVIIPTRQATTTSVPTLPPTATLVPTQPPAATLPPTPTAEIGGLTPTASG